MIINQ